MSFPLAVLLAAFEDIIEEELETEASSCFDDFDDAALFSLFHLSRPCLVFIADSLRARLQDAPPPDAPPQLSADALVMVALNYYAHGIPSASLLAKLGLTHTQCPAIIAAVSAHISDTRDRFVSFPRTEAAKATVAANVEAACGIPGVLGVLAAPHFRVRVSPYEQEDYRAFFSPLGFTAVVCQLICDADGNILSVDRCEVGSASEQQLWTRSVKGTEIERGQSGPYWIIAGKGYVQSHYVLTPLSDPATDSERRYNEAHAKILGATWSTLSRLMRRFKVLLQLGFAKESSLDQKSNIVQSCCVLHNVAQKFSVPSPPGDVEPVNPGKQHSGTVDVSEEALAARQELIHRAFAEAPGTEREA